MKQPVSLIALDMDGTLFNGQSEISKEDQDAIRRLTTTLAELSAPQAAKERRDPKEVDPVKE